MTTILVYADDVMLRINNAKKLQVNLNHLNNIGNTFGLKINFEKARNVLTRRREYGTYLATDRGHRRRLKMQKRDE